jgi:hypothetical protein
MREPQVGDEFNGIFRNPETGYHLVKLRILQIDGDKVKLEVLGSPFVATNTLDQVKSVIAEQEELAKL